MKNYDAVQYTDKNGNIQRCRNSAPTVYAVDTGYGVYFVKQ